MMCRLSYSRGKKKCAALFRGIVFLNGSKKKSNSVSLSCSDLNVTYWLYLVVVEVSYILTDSLLHVMLEYSVTLIKHSAHVFYHVLLT